MIFFLIIVIVDNALHRAPDAMRADDGYVEADQKQKLRGLSYTVFGGIHGRPYLQNLEQVITKRHKKHVIANLTELNTG